jgi:hypothetical protein
MFLWGVDGATFDPERAELLPPKGGVRDREAVCALIDCGTSSSNISERKISE